MYTARLEAVHQILAENNLQAIVFFGLPGLRYLCGFTGTDGVLLITASEAVFLTDSRYRSQAEAETSVTRIHIYKNKLAALVEEFERLSLTSVGFDADNLTVTVYEDLKKLAGQMAWVSLGEQIRTLRACKSPSELSALRQAATLNSAAFAEILPQIVPGITERQIALELEFSLKRLGGECNAFDFIVASGLRGALPHGIASDKTIQAGELVTIDFGTRVNGYYSDETVTLAVGEINGNLRQIFDIVLKAHDLALAAIRPGMELRDLDAVARDYIASQGYGDFFGHGLGHGVGLEIHEFPAISPRAEARVLERMVITIEPGIYVPGTGGVRIEDTVVVTADGHEALTGIPKQFYQIGTA